MEWCYFTAVLMYEFKVGIFSQVSMTLFNKHDTCMFPQEKDLVSGVSVDNVKIERSLNYNIGNGHLGVLFS